MSTYLYAGSFCPKGGAGYSAFRFDEDTGKVELISDELFPEISAGTAVFDAERGILYATDERPGNPAFETGGGGRVFALRVDPATGLLSKLDETLSYGVRPSFAAFDAEQRYLLVTNFGASKHAGVPVTKVRQDETGNWRVVVDYEDATTALLRLNEDGSFGGVCDVLVHALEGDPARPRVPHAHCVKRSPDGKWFAVCEMGTDKIYMLSVDHAQGKLIGGDRPYRYRKGYGPRYCAFHPTKPYLFVNTEDIPEVATFRYSEDGTLERLCAVNVMPEGHEPTPELHSGFTMSADGRFLYSAMRQYNLVNVLSVDQESGALERIQTYQLSGSHPKDCALSPDGKFLAVANRRSDGVELLRVAADGTLSATDIEIARKDAGVVFFLKF